MSARTSLPALLAAVLLGAFAPLLAAAPAAAHAGLTGSTPEDGAVLAAPPAEVRLTFSEAVREPAYVVVTAPDGTRSPGEAVVEGADAVQELPEGGAGGWTIAYRVVSADGHPITGELSFTVEGGEPARGAGTLEEDDAAAAPAVEKPSEGLWGRHADHVVLGGGLLLAAGALVQVSRRTRA